MDWSSTPLLLDELQPRTKGGYPDIWQTNAPSPHVLTVLLVSDAKRKNASRSLVALSQWCSYFSSTAFNPQVGVDKQIPEQSHMPIGVNKFWLKCFPDLNFVLTEVPTSVFGDKLREQVEERLSFYETGEVPRKNVDVMKDAVKEVSSEIKFQRCFLSKDKSWIL